MIATTKSNSMRVNPLRELLCEFFLELLVVVKSALISQVIRGAELAVWAG